MMSKTAGFVLIALIVLGHLDLGTFNQFFSGFWKDVIVLIVGILLAMR